MYQEITNKHFARSAVVRQYFKDRNSDPELVGYWKDYVNGDHNYIRYLERMASSPDFAKLALKYGTQPDVLSYAVDLVRSSPQEVTDSWNEYAAKDNAAAKELAVNLLHSAGLPVSLAQSLSNGKMDPKQAASQIMSAAPGLPGGMNLQQLLQQQQSGRQ